MSVDGQQTIQHLDRTRHRGYDPSDLQVDQQLSEVIHRLDRIGRLVFENETPAGRMTPTVPGPDEVAQIAEVDVVVTDEDASDPLRAVHALGDLGEAPTQLVGRQRGAP